jgi:hypothetical protein
MNICMNEYNVYGNVHERGHVHVQKHENDIDMDMDTNTNTKRTLTYTVCENVLGHLVAVKELLYK